MSAGKSESAYSYYVVICLMLASAFSYLDRMVLNLLIDPIRKDLHLSDSQVSLLAGAAFALSFVSLAFIFGRWVDLHKRRNAIVFGVSIWSLATTACGLANSFGKLFAARSCVGVGEASLHPSATSLIADYFPPHRRGTAMAIYACGGSMGGGLSILVGGHVVQWVLQTQPHISWFPNSAPWQLVFVLIGLPGLLVALLIAISIREPVRRLTAVEHARAAPQFSEVARFVGLHWKIFVPLLLGFSFVGVAAHGFSVWGPTYFMRLHQFTPVDVGLLFGLGFGVGGTLAILGGGALSDRLMRGGKPDAPLIVSVCSAVLQIPFFIGAYLASSAHLAASLFCIAVFVASLGASLQTVVVLALAPNRMRGTLTALLLVSTMLIGLAIGPIATAFASDHVFGGPTGIGRSLAATTTVALGMAVILLLISRGRARELAASLLI